MPHFSRKVVLDTFTSDVLDRNFVVRDAKKKLTVETTRKDVERAVPKDPACCVFGQAFKRLGIPALIYRSVAYVARSRKLVEKFEVHPMSRAVILANDLVVGERQALKGLVGLPLMLRPPTGCQRVGYRPRKPGEKNRSGQHSTPAVVAARKATYELLKPNLR